MSIFLAPVRLTFIVIESRIQVQLFATSWPVAHQASLSSTISCNLLKFMSVESVIPSNHLILCRPLLLSSRLQSFPASGSFPRSQLFTSHGQNIGVSASTSVLPMNTQDWSPLGWTPQFKSINSSTLSFLYSPILTSIHDHRKNHSLD